MSLRIENSSLSVSQGSNAALNVTIARTGTTGKVTLSANELPAGVTATYQNPGSGTTGRIAVAATASTLSGSYSVTVIATDGSQSSAVSLKLNINLVPRISGPHSWISTAPLISAIPDATHPITAVKDPTVVYWNNKWHVYATTSDTSGAWSMVYLNFTDWSQAAAAKPYYMDATSGLAGYHCAPELFYFTPQKKWYLIYQSGPPTYSTTNDPSLPSTWTAPKGFFSSQPSTVSGWLDFWIICDSADCYLFFTGDNGKFYRSQTTVADFPNGFSTPKTVMQAVNPGDLFEASNTYKLKGTNQYLTLVEAIGGPSGRRYFRAFVTDHLDGDWTPLASANSFETPFLGINNVIFDAGVSAWTEDFSHGEIIRSGYDEQLEIDPHNMRFLFQGTSKGNSNYALIPWQLGIAKRK